MSVLLQNSLSQDPHQCLKPTLGGSLQRPLSGSVYITPDLRSLDLELGVGGLCVLMSGLIKSQRVLVAHMACVGAAGQRLWFRCT